MHFGTLYAVCLPVAVGTQAIEHGAPCIHRKAMLAEHMLLESGHLMAVDVDEFSALLAFEVIAVALAAFAGIEQLKAGTLLAFGGEPYDQTLTDKLVKLPIYGCERDSSPQIFKPAM